MFQTTPPLLRVFFVVALLLLVLIPVSSSRAGVYAPWFEPMSIPASTSGERFSLSLESAYLFQPIANPFFAIAGRYNKNPLDYYLATQIVSVRYRLTDTGGPGPLRGNLGISAGFLGSAIVRGPESFYAGYVMGLRYTFVPRNLALKPYVEVRGGVGWTDSQDFRYAQQQDLTFTYLLGVGVCYDLGPRLSVTLGALDQHISNAYLTRPNYGFDSVGVQFGVTHRF